MTKRRGRRLVAEPGQDRSEPAPPVARTSDAASHTRISYFFFFLFLLIPIVSIAVYRLKYPPTHTHTVLSVLERDLVKPNIGFQEIIAENSKASENTSFRHFPHPVLAYVTPWNSKGYEMAKRFTSKITHLSPVWYNLKSDGSQLLLEGRHNADTGWISELRRNGNSLVLPRVVLEALPNQLLRKKKQWKKAIDLIITECKEIGYDGIVLESWSRWTGYGILHDPDMRSMKEVQMHISSKLYMAVSVLYCARVSEVMSKCVGLPILLVNAPWWKPPSTCLLAAATVFQ